MSSNLRVNSIVPASGTNVAIGTVGGTITYNANVSGVSTFSSGIVVAAGTTAAPSISPSGDSNTGIFFPSADTVAIGEGGTEVLRVNSTGGVQIANGNLIFSTAGTGIDFSATANSSGSTASELLSDYESGNWTPTPNSGTSSLNKATYTKIGNRVWYQADFSLTGTRSGTQFQIGGLPYVVIAAGWSAGSTYAAVMNTDFRTMCSLPDASSGSNSYLIIQVIRTDGTGGVANGTDFGNGYFNVTGFYETAS